MTRMRVEVSPGPIMAAARLADFISWAGDVGAVVSFTGVARATSADGPILALDLDIYPGFTEAAISTAVASLAEAEGLVAAEVVHRHGLIEPGEAIVWVATAAAHRRPAFRACDRIMDWLKLEAPIWKRERLATGWRWIEPTDQDRADAARWRAV